MASRHLFTNIYCIRCANLQNLFFGALPTVRAFRKVLLNGLLRSDEMLDVAMQGFVNYALLPYACAFAIQIGVVLK